MTTSIVNIEGWLWEFFEAVTREAAFQIFRPVVVEESYDVLRTAVLYAELAKLPALCARRLGASAPAGSASRSTVGDPLRLVCFECGADVVTAGACPVCGCGD